jgi:(p)ppGpp synthase/HD superfamily hydrolase
MTDNVPQLSDRMTAAFEMARDVHNGQLLKGSQLPYLLHLLDACSIALRHGADEDLAIAALLHDVVEDGGGEAKADEIGAAFGERVKQIVVDCSDSLVEDSEDKKPWWDRKIQYLDHLHVASEDTAMVSTADKLSNARSIVVDVAEHGDEFWTRFKTGRVGSLWYYRRIAEVLPGRLPETDRAQRLGRSLQDAVADMFKLVSVDQAKADWHAAFAEEQRVRESHG